jgi:uncharacterized protein DUF1553/uncharacterized protein DUF1549
MAGFSRGAACFGIALALASLTAITSTAAPAARGARPAVRTPQGGSEHWAFRPLRPVKPPEAAAHPPAGPVDRFILDALRKKGLTPAPAADRRKLIRRVYFDVVGLPPPPEEVEAFLKDTTAGGYEKLVDRLLASPRYGERWARHWLDVARYADSNGQEGDQDRPNAYHYRDFVIWALNEDLPYDTFVRWQLAGDEIAPDEPRAVAATGFITAGPHTVLDVPMAEEKIRNRLNELDDQLSTTGSAFLGLTLGCARCHDHKYDPVPTLDYYRLLTAFNSGDRAEVPLGPRAEVAKRREAEQAWKQQVDTARKELDDWLAAQKRPLTAQLQRARIEALPVSTAEKTLLAGSPNDPAAQQLSRKYARQLKIEDADYRPLFSEAQRARWDALAGAVRGLETRKPAPLPVALAMADFVAAPRETWLLDRGDLYRKKERVELGFVSALTRGRTPSEYWARAKAAGTRQDTTYQRRALADWITDTEHGAGALLARVIVNRLWQHHFGEGLVRTVNDFGLQGERPSHPELLEWLAWELVRGGWKLKPIHRLILTSSTYRQSSATQGSGFRVQGSEGGQGEAGSPNPQSAIRNPQLVDPENRLLWRRRPRRLEVEAFRDAALSAAGTLNHQMYGPSFKPPIQPEAIQARNVKDPYPSNLKDTPETRRRSVYMFHKRVVQYPLMQAFDGPDGAASCGRRSVTTVAPQALAILNEPFVRLRAGEFARRLVSEAGTRPADQVERAYRLALGRPPSVKELASSVRFIEQQTAARAGRENAGDAPLLALTDFAQVVFGLNEFMYVD